MTPRFKRLAPACAALLLSGCYVQSSTVVRGNLLRTTEIGHETKDSPVVQVDDRGVARLGGVRRECKLLQHDYAQTRHEVLDHMATSAMVLTPLALLAGPAIMFGATQVSDKDTRDMLFPLGALVMLSSAGFLMFGILNSETSERDVEVEEPLVEKENACEDGPLRVTGNVPWKLTLRGERREATSWSDGSVELRPVMFSLLAAKGDDEPLLADALANNSIAFDLKMGDAPDTSVKLDPRLVPEKTWQQWERTVATELEPSRRLRFDACSAFTASAREHLDCLVNPGRYAQLVRHSGWLEPAPEGYYAALEKFTAQGWNQFSYLVLLPREGADWLVRIVDADTGEVVAESYSKQSRYQLLTGTFPRAGSYGLVFVGKERAYYEAALTLVKRAPTLTGEAKR